MAATDAQLVEGLRRGEDAAFSQTYARYRAPIFSFLLRLSRDRQVALDLSQELWMRLARHALRLRPDTRLAAWLFTVARRLHVSHRRWAVVDAARRLGWSLRPQRVEDDDTPYDVAAAAETQRRLEVAIGQLSVRYREVLLLVAVQGFDANEVGTMLGLSAETVRQRLSRARSMLGDALGGRP